MNMNRQDYITEIANDVKEWLKDSLDDGTTDLDEFVDEDGFVFTDELVEHLNEECWIADSVTGNASGSYTFNAYKAEENILGAWSLLQEVWAEWGIEDNPFEKSAEYWDVTIRCYLLYEAIQYCLSDLESLLLEEWENRGGAAE